MNYYSLLGYLFEDTIHNLILQCGYKVLRVATSSTKLDIS